jgi:RES domain-containing protein
VERSLVERVAAISPSDVHGTFYRHAAPNRDAFAGGLGGRWGHAFPVIYLGRPPDSVVIEAYRHLVEEAGVAPERVRPRVLYTVQVSVQRVLDLTSAVNLQAVGLTDDDLITAVDDYAPCQAVAAVAHQLEYHAILAPAATGRGQTLAIFRTRVGAAELPCVESEVQWGRLPTDPRQLRVVRETGTEPTQ